MFGSYPRNHRMEGILTRSRMFGSDVPFCAWLREQKDLPSYSSAIGFVATDVDLIVHRYLTEVDSEGTRQIQALMHLEVKTRSGVPHDSQLDTLCKLNLFHGKRDLPHVHLRYWGVSVLSMDGTTPDNSRTMYWARFPESRNGQTPRRWDNLNVQSISHAQLIGLLRFDLHPDNLTRRPFRRHHKTMEVVVEEMMPLGFTVEKTVIKRS
jgi:hypothetical protein